MPFELKWIHLIGPLLATIAMFFVGDNFVRQERGKDIRIVPTIVMFALALGFHFIFSEGNFLDRISYILLDFGIGMIIDSAYLKRKNVNPKVFWGLGMVSLVGGILMIFFLHFFGLLIVKAKDWVSGNPEITTKIELLVELGPDDQIAEIAPMMKKYGATWVAAFPEVDLTESEDLAQYYLVTVSEKESNQLLLDLDADDENVDHAEINFEISLEEPILSANSGKSPGNFLANDPRISAQWWMEAESTNQIHEILKNAKPAKKAIVAIVDTGVDAAHEDVKEGFDKSPDGTDNHGHGTHCACLAGAITNNKNGIASLNWEGKYIKVRSFAALNKSGQGTIYSVAKAIIAARWKQPIFNSSRSSIHLICNNFRI